MNDLDDIAVGEIDFRDATVAFRRFLEDRLQSLKIDKLIVRNARESLLDVRQSRERRMWWRRRRKRLGRRLRRITRARRFKILYERQAKLRGDDSSAERVADPIGEQSVQKRKIAFQMTMYKSGCLCP